MAAEFTIGDGVARAAACRAYQRRAGDPTTRPLRVYTLDPSAVAQHGCVAIVAVPFEPIADGFRGAVFEIDPHDAGCDVTYEGLVLDERSLLLSSGRKPSPSDPLFHQQMVYAVSMTTYARFRAALGRDLAWGFEHDGGDASASRLRLRPWAFDDAANAFYDKASGEISFGYLRAPDTGAGAAPPRGPTFACLSHDIVVHEVTHALLDGLRSHFACPTGCDVLAFHEGFADLVALLQRFSYAEVVEDAIGEARGRLDTARPLTEIAAEFGWLLGGRRGHGLRTAIDPTGKLVYQPDTEPHQLGSVLVSAVFDAFVAVYDRKIRRFLRLATGGTAHLPPGDLGADLRQVLAQEASKLAQQFLTICIRALDYCPPVDIELGEFLRAVITADHELVADDPWSYRQALIEAFRVRRIYPRGVAFMSEDALLWDPPGLAIAPVRRLSFAELRFDGDPARPAGADELRAQAAALGATVTAKPHLDTFGLARAGDPRLDGDQVEVPCVQSIRSARRVGPDGQVLFDLIAEVTQVRHVRARGAMPACDFIGGSTVVVGPNGEIRYVIVKGITNDERKDRQLSMVKSSDLWELDAGSGRRVPSRQPFRLVHSSRPQPGPA